MSFHKPKISSKYSFAIGRGLNYGVVSYPCTFYIYPINKFSRYIQISDEKIFTVEIFQKKVDNNQEQFVCINLPIEYKLDKAGRIEINFTPTEKGKYLISVSYKKINLPLSPFELEVKSISEKNEINEIKNLATTGWEFEVASILLRFSKNPINHDKIFKISLKILSGLHKSRFKQVQQIMCQVLSNLLSSERNKIKLSSPIGGGGIHYIENVIYNNTFWINDVKICKFIGRIIHLTIQTNENYKNNFLKIYGVPSPLYSIIESNDKESIRYCVHTYCILAKSSNENLQLLAGNELLIDKLLHLIHSEDIVISRYCLETTTLFTRMDNFQRTLNSDRLTLIMNLLNSSERRIQLDALSILSKIHNSSITQAFIACNIFEKVYECITTETILSWWEIGLFKCNPENYLQEHYASDVENILLTDLNISAFQYLNQIFSYASRPESEGIAEHISEYNQGKLLQNICKLAGAIESRIQQESCKTVSYIASHPTLRERLINSSCIVWIFATIKHIHLESNPSILITLANISHSFNENTKIPDDSKIIGILLKLLSSNDVNIQKNAAITLGHLSKIKKYYQRILQEGNSRWIDLLIASARENKVTLHNDTIKYSDIQIMQELASSIQTKVSKCNINGEILAIKYFDNQVGFNKSEFYTEVCLTSILKHPRIVQSRYANINPPNLFIVFKLYSYGSIADLIKNSAIHLQFSMIISMLIDAAEGIEYLHSLNIIHRDIKPGNFLIDDEFRVYLTDFGTTRVVNKRMSAAIGTVLYMAPEIFESNSYSSKIDVFSFAILMWELLERKSPYPNHMQFIDIVSFVQGGNRPKFSKKNRNSPLIDLIKCCWHDDPEKRPSFPEILLHLRNIKSQFCSDPKIDFSHLLDLSNTLTGVSIGQNAPQSLQKSSRAFTDEPSLTSVTNFAHKQKKKKLLNIFITRSSKGTLDPSAPKSPEREPSSSSKHHKSRKYLSFDQNGQSSPRQASDSSAPTSPRKYSSFYQSPRDSDDKKARKYPSYDSSVPPSDPPEDLPL